MSSKRSSTSAYFNMFQGSDRNAIEVRDQQNNEVASVLPGTYIVNGKTIEAWDLRRYTMGNFDLKATTTNDKAILTYYAGSANT